MSKLLRASLLVVLLLSLLPALTAQAQDTQPEPRATPTPVPPGGSGEGAAADDGVVRGSIRGTVYRDANNDGGCGGTAEGPLAGIPLRFVSADGTEDLYLQSGDDGTYGLVAMGLGYWEVFALPEAGQGVVTSASPRGVTITEENPVALGVDFCIGTAPPPSQVVLPVSGAPARPGFWLVTALGFLLLGAGAGLHWRRRSL